MCTSNVETSQPSSCLITCTCVVVVAAGADGEFVAYYWACVVVAVCVCGVFVIYRIAMAMYRELRQDMRMTHAEVVGNY